MTNVVIEMLDSFYLGMSPDTPACRPRVFTSNFKFLIGVNEYFERMDFLCCE